MTNNAHLNYFKINECGLYLRDSKTRQGLNTAETFIAIYDWVKGKPLEDTLPWDPLKSRTGVSKCYCHDVYLHPENGDFLLVLWKSDTSSKGSILGAVASAQTGNGRVVEKQGSHLGEKVIWGKPCYYWIIPSLETIISIKTENSSCDSRMFQCWITSAINNRISLPNKRKTTTDGGKIRLEFINTKTEPPRRYTFRFDVSLRTACTGSSELKFLAEKITHIIRRDTIKLQEGIDERAAWTKIFDKLPFASPKPEAKSRQIEIKAEAKPSPAEITAIIEKYSEEERAHPNDWNRVGFLTTDNSIVWADRYRIHENINITTPPNGIFTAVELYLQLMQQRERITSHLKTENSTSSSPKIAEG